LAPPTSGLNKLHNVCESSSLRSPDPAACSRSLIKAVLCLELNVSKANDIGGHREWLGDRQLKNKVELKVFLMYVLPQFQWWRRATVIFWRPEGAKWCENNALDISATKGAVLGAVRLAIAGRKNDS
jgi:hypothetical protein